ncbi:unnamed protein product [Lupinus luteus]|uniref:Uncharacterized protein n=1 Tax=Lupinus luteus TaxID=3873 RepID=A0AAV1Y113_LUPLU
MQKKAATHADRAISRAGQTRLPYAWSKKLHQMQTRPSRRRMSFQYEPLHRHQSDRNIGHRHSFSTQENEFMNTLFAANAGTPDSSNIFFNDMNFNFNQGDGAGPSSSPIDENIFPTEQPNTTQDQTRVQRRDVPRRTRRPCRCGTGSHFGDV